MKHSNQNTPVSHKEEKVITIDIQHLLTPVAILLSGMMVSATLFFSLRDATLSDGSDVQGAAVVADDANPTEAGGGDNPLNDPKITKTSSAIGDDPVKGDKGKAKIAIIEFTDYECPFCQRHYQQTYSSIIKNFVDTGKAIYVSKDFPLSFHPQAKPASMAANCVREQGGDEAYFKYHDLLFGKGVAGGTSAFEGYAGELGLNNDKFKSCYSSNKFDSEIQADVAEGGKAGVTGTPGFVIGTLDKDGNVTGYKVPGAYPYSTFETLVNDLLK